MSDTNDTEERSGGKTLSMRRGVEQGRVKQNFSHGRSKTVVVETKRRRTISSPGAKPLAIEPKVKPKSLDKPAPKAKPAEVKKPSGPKLSTTDLDLLS